MKVVLLGYMASGKSIIAKKLGENLLLKHIDLDDYIAKKENQTIPELFKSKGEIYFRLIENKALLEVLSLKEDVVLSVGGGTPCYANNMELIMERSLPIYLKASIDTIYNRIINEKEQRPLIKNISNDKLKEFIAKHLFERNHFYNKASIIIDVNNKSVDKITNEISIQIGK